MNGSFSKNEKKLIGGISVLMAVRMLGVSLIIPVFSILATEMSGSSEMLAGIAVGIFGISQTLFQIPMGRLSDRKGRKETALIGLGIYFAGTVLSGFALNIYHLIIARFIAGAGAVSGVTTAWLTDGVRLDRRNAAMAAVGMSIGLSVILGFSLSPLIAAYLSAPFLFFISAFFTLATIIYTYFFLENNNIPPDPEESLQFDKKVLKQIFLNPDLRRLNLTGMICSISLISVFFCFPLMLKEAMGMGGMWKIFVPMAVIGTFMMYRFSREADKRGAVKISKIALLMEITALAAVLISQSTGHIIFSFILFYAGHCIISPLLPAAISGYPESAHKGTVMSLFHSSQFVGSGIGGFVSGVMFGLDVRWLFAMLMVLLACAFLLTGRFSEFRKE